MSADKLMLYVGGDQMESAMLRSVLLFNGKVSNPNRHDMMLKAVLSIIIYGEGATKASDIIEVLSNRFKVDLNEKDISQYIEKLKKRGLATENVDGTIVANMSDRGKASFFDKLGEDTQKLIDGVLERINKESHISLSENDKKNIPHNIKTALSVYYGTYGYKHFGVLEDPDDSKLESAVDCAREGLSKAAGQATVRAIADLLASPTDDEYDTLETWARAYVAMEVMNLDSVLRNFKLTKMSQKSFVIDTDVVLHAITTHAQFSRDYRLMIDRLKAAGCKIYIPQRVVEEILDHIDSACKWYGGYGPQVLEFTDEMLAKIGNVFIEDYVKMLREKPEKRDMPFDVYLDNFRSEEYPSLIWTCLEEVFGKGVSDNHFVLEPLDGEVKNKLKSRVLEETIETQKGAHRTVEKNEEIAELDTALYMTLLKMNQNDNGDDKPLSRRTYLLTGSDRTNKCAKDVGLFQKDICCDPKGLLAIMQEAGSLEGQKVGIINLFDNPFLVYTANEVWKEVDPLLRNGARMKYVELRKIRLDVDAHLDRILTCKTHEERVAEAQRQTKRGYLFAQDLVEANQTIEEQDKTIAAQKNTIQDQSYTIAELQAKLEKKDQENRKEAYQRRVLTGRGKKKNGSN